MALIVTLVAIFAVALLSFAESEGNVISRRQSVNCSNIYAESYASGCVGNRTAAFHLALEPNVTNFLDQIRGHISIMCSPPCFDLLRQSYADCARPDLSSTEVDGVVSFHCDSGPDGMPCPVLIIQERGQTLHNNVNSECASTSQPESSTDCSSSCRAALVSQVEYEGCWLGSRYAFIRASLPIDPGPPPAFATCNVSLPEVCGSATTPLRPVISLVFLAGLLVVSLM